MKKPLTILAILLAFVGGAGLTFLLLGGPKRMALASKPPKTAHVEPSPSREEAEAFFWSTLWKGDYDGIPKALLLQKAAYLENPRDPDLALHIALLHLWRLAERFRQGEQLLPGITDDLVMARKYFEEAKKLAPDDARIDGWLAGAMMGEGHVHQDQKLTVDGYFRIKEGVRDYPAFNLFSMAYILGGQPHDSERFEEAIDALFQSMDITNHAPVDRNNPTIANDLVVRDNEADEDIRRAVGNTEKAPYNIEGFFLVFGDMLVKKGDTKTAEIIYKNAQIRPSYKSWPYRGLLEQRLENLDRNVELFRNFKPTREALQAPDLVETSMVFNSYNCVICHQAE